MPDSRHSSVEAAADASAAPPPPAADGSSAWIRRWSAHLPVNARVLDLAAGQGRNVGPALARQARVLAVDRDADALARIDPRVATRQLDVEGGPWQLPRASFDAVIVCNYLFRPRLSLLPDLLAPGGLLLYETFAVGNAHFGRPSNPDFLLRPGELLELAARGGLAVIAYEDGRIEHPRPARVQRLCAARPPIPPDGFRLEGALG